MSAAERGLRQRELVPPDRLSHVRATVVGVGAVGRQVAIQLAALGVPRLQLIDHDTVEAVNLAPQGFYANDIGRAKTSAVAEICHQINPMLNISTEQARFRRSMEVGDTLFCCVDSIRTRKLIWRAVEVDFFCDGRMAGEALRVLTACDRASRHHYPTTLFPASQAFEAACTSRSTIYSANICAGLMVHQLTRYLRRLPVDPDLQLNLLSSEMSVCS